MKLVIIATALAGLAATSALGVQAPDTTAAAIVVDCSSRKFETSVEIEKDGQKRLTRLKLCAVKDADEASWVRTLEDAKAKIASHPDISDDSKAKIVAELDAEIARIKTGAKAPTLPGVAPVASAKPPAGPAAPTASAMAKQSPPSRVQGLAKPRLTIRCLEQGELGDGGPCTGLGRHTRLAIRADGDLVEGTSLRFLRRGDVRGEVALAQMRQGQSIRLNLPPKLCAGVASSKVEIQILGSNQVVETLGPYLLRC